MYTTSDFRNGLKIEFDGSPFVIVYFQHVKPGKGGAFVRTKLKNLKTGAVIEHTFRSGDKVEKPDLDERDMQFMYKMEGQFHFIDTRTYEQIYIDAGHVEGDARSGELGGVHVAIDPHRRPDALGLGADRQQPHVAALRGPGDRRDAAQRWERLDPRVQLRGQSFVIEVGIAKAQREVIERRHGG